MSSRHSRPIKVVTQKEISIDTGAFWSSVIECLVDFHEIPLAEARQQVDGFKARLRKAPERLREDINVLTYHDEPFHVACGLAQRKLEIREHQEPYQRILDRQGW